MGRGCSTGPGFQPQRLRGRAGLVLAVAAVAFVGSGAYVFINTVVDILQAVADPRIVL